MSYKLNKLSTITGKQTTVTRTNDDGTKSYIPFDEANSDYQKYLDWVDAGNTPEAAD